MARPLKKAFKKFKKKSIYSKSLLLFIFILIILFVLCLSYVYKSLIAYENNMPENYIKNITSNKTFMSEVSKVKIPESEFDKDNDVEKAVKSFLKSDKTVWIAASPDAKAKPYLPPSRSAMRASSAALVGLPVLEYSQPVLTPSSLCLYVDVW